jgi:universal stress protein E
MAEAFAGYQSVLAATDFSPHGEWALKQAVWIAQQGGKSLVVASVVADLRQAVHHTTYRARIEFLEGDEEDFQRQLRRSSDEQLKKQIAALGPTQIDVKYETLLGEPHEELIHAVQQERYDLVIAGTRGHSGLASLVLGSTAKRLVRNCPASVWIVKTERAGAPRSVLAAVDLSDVSRRALNQAAWVARRAQSPLHVVHVIEGAGFSTDMLETKIQPGGAKTLRQLIEAEANQLLNEFLATTDLTGVTLTTELAWGAAAQETVRVAGERHADLVVLGTVGRRGLQGLLLGNTAESVLTHSECDVLTVKPADFVCPIAPPTWPLHPGPEGSNPA